MSSRLATDAEVSRWSDQGWVLLEGLIGTDEIDAAADDIGLLFPSVEEYYSDPEEVTERRRGRPLMPKQDYAWPEEVPGSGVSSRRWMGAFPFDGSGVLNRLCVHPSLIDFAERAIQSTDLRLYQAHASAKYSGLTNYEQPMHTDRNHSWLPAVGKAPWWNLTGFLYLTDVTEDREPHQTGYGAGLGRDRLSLPGDPASRWTPSCMPLSGQRPGSVVLTSPTGRMYGTAVPRSKHRKQPVSTWDWRSGTAGQDWIGYDTQQSRSTGERVDPFRRGFDAARTGAVRLSGAGTSHLDRIGARRDCPALPEAGSHPWWDGLASTVAGTGMAPQAPPAHPAEAEA